MTMTMLREYWLTFAFEFDFSTPALSLIVHLPLLHSLLVSVYRLEVYIILTIFIISSATYVAIPFLRGFITIWVGIGHDAVFNSHFSRISEYRASRTAHATRYDTYRSWFFSGEVLLPFGSV